MENTHINFIYHYHERLVRLFNQETKKYQNGGAVFINMSSARMKSGNMFVNFMALELLPKYIVDKFRFNPMKKVLTINCAPIDKPYDDKNQLVTLIVKIDKDEFVLRGRAVPIAGGKYSYTFQMETDKDIDKTEKGDWAIRDTKRAQAFLQLCRDSVKDNDVFNNFRSKQAYNEIIIPKTQNECEMYLKRFKTEYVALMQFRKQFQENDIVGNPSKVDMPEFGLVSHDTLRHMNTLGELIKYFGQMNKFNIVEIGGGYGGLCKTISCVVKYKEYTLIDLPEVQSLSQKYLKSFNSMKNMNVKYLNSNRLTDINLNRRYDLLISEFTLSEMNTKAISYYINTVLMRATNCYLVMNLWDEDAKKSFIDILKKLYRLVEEFPEYPKGEWPNYVIVCKGLKMISVR